MHPILFFADRLPPQTGGMEMHARFFIEHFQEHPTFPIVGVITKNAQREDCIVEDSGRTPCLIAELSERFVPKIVFFNSGRWIEQLRALRHIFPKALLVYRTGGNEIIKAPLETHSIPSHKQRQQFWADTLNESLNQLITNSAFTEARLKDVGISSGLFYRCVGGVDATSLTEPRKPENTRIRLFCGARFVPYKNHRLLLDIFEKLLERNPDRNLELRLAGDGPLLEECQQRTSHLSDSVVFLGRVTNERSCREIAAADYYVQFSEEYITRVEGGSYVHAEGMGRTILEAITAGTFVLALRKGALPEIVTSDRGYLFDSDNVLTIAEQMEEFLRAPVPRPKTTTRYDWSEYFQLYERAWEELCAH